jgi:two-component system chemotaxis response regulator CheY
MDPHEPPKQTGNQMQRKILTADDSKSVRQMISFTLRRAGYEIREAEDGAAALSMLQTEAMDLLITDLDMPQLGGLELIGEVRKLPGRRKMPILILTTESDAGIKDRARTAGAAGWITKPFTPKQLIGAVEKVLP